MILIYSKDVDDFVNNVIDCLDEDFIRIGESDKVTIEAMSFSNEISSYTLIFRKCRAGKIKSIWHNDGDSYTLAGGYSSSKLGKINQAFLVDYNSKTKKPVI